MAVLNLPIGPSSGRSRMDLLTAIQFCGLTADLKLCLDAGDDASYPSGQKWLDVSGGGYDFFRGADATAESTDPDFTGTPGARSVADYFLSDGGDNFTYDTTNETWMNSLGKAGSRTFFSICRIASDSTTRLFSQHTSTGAADAGISFDYSATSNRFLIAISRADETNYVTFGGAGPDVSASLPATFIVGHGLTLAADGSGSYDLNVNGTAGSNTYVAATEREPHADDPAGTSKIWSRSDNTDFAPSGSRMFCLAIWDAKLSADSLSALYNTMRGRFAL